MILVLSKQVPSFSSFDSSNNKENRTGKFSKNETIKSYIILEVESIIKQDQQQQQQTSFVGLQRSSTQEER
jgi:predicted XRE-type DNA-binding protein